MKLNFDYAWVLFVLALGLLVLILLL